MSSRRYSVGSKQYSVGWVVWLFLMIALIGCQAEQGEEATAVVPATLPPTEEAIVPTNLLPTEEAVATATAVPQPTNTPEPSGKTAADADVLNVKAVQTAKETWTFHVTVAHLDNGWDDYADGWDVLLPDGTVLKPDPGSPFTRLLLHPHDNEQPFTRSQSGIIILTDITQVTVRAHDLVDGFGGQEVVVDLTADAGESFTVERLDN